MALSSQCLCHKEGVKGVLTSFSGKSWKTFQHAALVRNDDVSKSMENKWSEGPFGMYHRTCYQMYTGKDHLERAVKKRKLSDNNDLPESLSTEVLQQPLTCSLISTTDTNKCMICQTEKNDPKDRRRKERLTICQTETAGKTLIQAAMTRGDQRIVLAMNGEDPVALKVSYHRSCYRIYTSPRNLQSVTSDNNENRESERQLYDEAFQELKKELEPELFERMDVLRMSDLRLRFVQILFELGIDNPGYRTEKLKTRLRNAFSDKKSFWHPRHRSESELVWCSRRKTL